MASDRTNDFGQPIGLSVPDWQPSKHPERIELSGRFCRLVPLDAALHGPDLYKAVAQPTEDHLWTYMFSGPFSTYDDFAGWLAPLAVSQDPLFYTILDAKTGVPVGMASYLRITPAFGSIEVGNIMYAPHLQKTSAATEVMSLMMAYAFDSLGYRRYEWKCDHLNAGSRRAADRLGFAFEGIFRQALVYKGRNRDTAWYAITDQDWPRLRAAYKRWLDPDNFTTDGAQKQSLSHFVYFSDSTI